MSSQDDSATTDEAARRMAEIRQKRAKLRAEKVRLDKLERNIKLIAEKLGVALQ